MLTTIHSILCNLRSALNWRSYTDALERRWLTDKTWDMLLDRSPGDRWPRFWFHQGTMALACADHRLELHGYPVLRDTKYQELFNIAQRRDPQDFAKVARTAEVTTRTLYNYLDDREPQFWCALRISAQYPNGVRVVHCPDWYFEFCSAVTPSSTRAPRAADRRVWNEILRRKLAGEPTDALAREYFVEPPEIERICSMVTANNPDILGALLGVSLAARRRRRRSMESGRRSR